MQSQFVEGIVSIITAGIPMIEQSEDQKVNVFN